jgi:uncharacterized membrane protein
MRQLIIQVLRGNGKAVIALAGLLTWQFSHSPNLQRSSLAQRANAQVQKTVEQVGGSKISRVECALYTIQH